MFLNNKRRSADAHSQENTCVEFSSSTLLKRDASTGVLILQIFEEHLRTVASKVTLESDCLEFCLWTVTFKTILTYPGNITKIPVAFKPDLETQFSAYVIPYATF